MISDHFFIVRYGRSGIRKTKITRTIQGPLTKRSEPLALAPLAVVTSGPCTVTMVSGQTTKFATTPAALRDGFGFGLYFQGIC